MGTEQSSKGRSRISIRCFSEGFRTLRIHGTTKYSPHDSDGGAVLDESGGIVGGEVESVSEEYRVLIGVPALGVSDGGTDSELGGSVVVGGPGVGHSASLCVGSSSFTSLTWTVSRLG